MTREGNPSLVKVALVKQESGVGRLLQVVYFYLDFSRIIPVN